MVKLGLQSGLCHIRHIFVRMTLVCLFLLTPTLTLASEVRVALVIANSRYQAVPALPNPSSDAELIGASLRRAGFQTVTIVRDQTKAQMETSLRDFSRLADRSDVAVVYYAGHGIEVGGTNFLVPIDARLRVDRDLELEALQLETVTRMVEGARRLKMVVLDACRENPFAVQMGRSNATRSIGRGLGRVEPDGDTVVWFAAKAGALASDGTGRNSPFAEAFAQRVVEPGLEISRFFRKVRDDVKQKTNREQEPFFYGSLSADEFYFVPIGTGGGNGGGGSSVDRPVNQGSQNTTQMASIPSPSQNRPNPVPPSPVSQVRTIPGRFLGTQISAMSYEPSCPSYRFPVSASEIQEAPSRAVLNGLIGRIDGARERFEAFEDCVTESARLDIARIRESIGGQLSAAATQEAAKFNALNASATSNITRISAQPRDPAGTSTLPAPGLLSWVEETGIASGRLRATDTAIFYETGCRDPLQQWSESEFAVATTRARFNSLLEAFKLLPDRINKTRECRQRNGQADYEALQKIATDGVNALYMPEKAAFERVFAAVNFQISLQRKPGGLLAASVATAPVRRPVSRRN